MASAVACARSFTFSFTNRLLICRFTVSSEMNNCAPISLLLNPRPSSCKISSSRGLRSGPATRAASRDEIAAVIYLSPFANALTAEPQVRHGRLNLVPVDVDTRSHDHHHHHDPQGVHPDGDRLVYQHVHARPRS